MADSGRGADERSSRRRERREARLREIRPDAEGNYSYIGDMWHIAGSDTAGSGRRQRLMLAAGLALITAVVVGSGFMDSRNAMGTYYVVIPYIGEVSTLFFLVWNLTKLIFPDSVRTYTLEQTRGKISPACRILLVFAVIGLAFSSGYLIANGMEGKSAESIAYLLLKAAAAFTAEWTRRVYDAAEWEKAE